MANKLTTSNGLNLQVGMTFDTDSARQRLSTALNQLQKQAKPTIQTEVYIDNERFVKTVRTYQDALKNLVEETTLYNGAGKVMSSTITNLTSASDRVEKEINAQAEATKKLSSAQQNLNKHITKSKTLFSDFADTFLKMAKFNTINLIYDGITSSLSKCVEITNDFNSAMIEFKKVTDTSNLSLTSYVKTLDELGETVGFDRTEMLEAATEFSKSGFDADAAAQLARVSSLYRNIADEELSAGDAASYIISQLKAFGMETDNVAETTQNALDIINKTNEVSNQFAVSSANIATALTKQSASLATYGNDINEVIGLVTASTEILTNNASKAARGIKTIGANIAQMAQQADSFQITVQGVQHTIKLFNDEGTDILSTYEVLEQVAKYWADMTDAEKTALAISQAGKNQIDVYTSTLNNFNSAIQAKTTALLADGSAERENEAAMSGLEKQTKALQAEYKNFVLSLPIEQIETSVLSLSKTLLKLFNSDLVQGIIKVAALTTAGLALLTVINKVGAWLVDIPRLLLSTISALTGVDASILSMNGLLANTNILLTTMKTLVLSNPLFIAGAAIAAVATAVVIFDKLNVTFKEANENLKELNSEIEKTATKINSTKDKLEEIHKQLEEINELKLNVIDDEELQILNKQYDALVRQSAELRNQLALEEGKLASQKKQQELEAKRVKGKSISATIYNVENGVSESGEPQSTAYTTTGKASEIGKQLVEGLKATQAEIDRCEQEMSQFSDTSSDAYQQLQSEQQEYYDEWVAMNDQMVNEILPTCDNVIKAGQDIDDEYQGVYDAYYEFMEKSKGTDFSLFSEEDVEEVEEVTDAITQFLNVADDYQSAYETLNKAANEYNKNGYISAATLKKLAQLDSEYQAQLEITNGTMTVTNGALQDQFNLSKQLAIIHAKTETETEALAYAQGYLADNIVTVGTDSKESQPKVSELSQAFTDLGHTTQEANKGIWAVRNALGDEEALEKFNKGLEEIYNRGAKRVENLEGIELDYVSSSKSSAGSHKDAWVEAFKEEQRQLKHALEMNEITEMEYYDRLKDLNEKYFGEISGKHQKYIKEYQENEEEIYKGTKAIYDKVKDYLKEAVEQGYEKAINAIKKEEKKLLAEIKSQIEALKKEKKNVLDGIKDQVNALKKEKEAVQKYYNDQIDAIKKENEVLQEQNELLEYQQALQQAKAQKVMVFQDGKFQLGENESAVAQAEQNLAQYQDKMSYEQQIQQLEDLRDAQVESIEARIESLEEYYDYMEDYYDKQIESMEEYYNQVQEQYEKQIEALQTELDAFKDGYQKAEDLENAKLAATVLAANEEAAVWQARLENLANAVSEYNKLLDMMGEAGTSATSSFTAKAIASEATSKVAEVDSHIQTRASGDASFRGNEIALVGESPNTELVLGSRLNNSLGGGSLVNLSRGSGVVNAESTATLAGLLNGLASPSVSNTSRTVQQNFTFGSISLPSVTDANSFVKTLSSQFNNYAIQYSTMKK